MLLYGPNLQPGAAGSSEINLYPGETYVLAPAGPYLIVPSKYHMIQIFDPVMQIWQAIGGADGNINPVFINSDGVNYRLANFTGCVVGALITNAGSGYTSAPTVSATGGSKWRAILGGAVGTSVTVTNAGANYTYAPAVVFSPPPPGGIPATGYCTLASSPGTVSSVTVVDQGAGYIQPPIISFLNDPREVNNASISAGYGAAAVATLTGAQEMTGLLCTDPGGTAIDTSVPTLTITGGGGSSAAATAIMNWTITAVGVTTAGAGLAGSVAILTALDNFPTTAPAFTNPKSQNGLVAIRNANIWMPVVTGGITTASIVIYDGGIYTSVPTPILIPNASVVTTAPVATLTMGGSAGTSYVYSLG